MSVDRGGEGESDERRSGFHLGEYANEAFCSEYVMSLCG